MVCIFSNFLASQGKRSDDPNHPEYVPSIFEFSQPTTSKMKKKLADSHSKFINIHIT